jgi:hypothetical protein
MDSFEAHPQALALSNGAANMKKTVINFFEQGNGLMILERLGKKEITISEAVAKISQAIGELQG